MVRTARVLNALLLALATFGLLLAGTGAAAADDAPGVLDGQFRVAQSRPGDHAVYALSLVLQISGKGLENELDGMQVPGLGDGQSMVVDAAARWELSRLADRVLPLDGGLQPVSSFESSWASRPFEGWGSGFDASDFSDADGYDYHSSNGASSADAGSDQIQGEPWHVVHIDRSGRAVALTQVATDGDLPGHRLAADLGVDLGTSVITVLGPAAAPCGWHSDLQDAPQPLDKPVRVEGVCPPAGGTMGMPVKPVTGNQFLAIGHDLVEGREAVVYDLVNDPGALRLWFTEDTPYPVRMLLPYLTVGDEDSFLVKMQLMYEMTSFAPGALDPAGAEPGPGLAPRLPAGPDAAGVAHPFPLEAALLAAQKDQEDKGTQQFLVDHPDAFVDEARFVHVQDGDTPEERWTFTLVGGADALRVTATKGAPREAQQVAGQPLPPQVPPLVVPGVIPGDDGVVVHSERGSASGHVGAGQLPADLPKVADILAAWQKDGAPAAGVPSWAFHLTSDGATWVAAGQASVAATRDNSQDVTYSGLAYSFLALDSQGRFRFVEESPARYDVPGDRDPDSLSPKAKEDDGGKDPMGFRYASVGFWTLPQTKTTATVSAAASLVGLLAYALLPAKFGLGLFSRIGSGQVLEHPLRQQITDLVNAEPGIHFQELVRRLDAGRGTMEHHLRKLVAADVLTMQVSQGFTCFFPKGKVDRHLMAAAPVLKSEGARQVLQAIQQSPGRAAQDVAGAIGLTPSTVNYHLKRLIASGLVAHERRGRFILLTPTPLGTQALGAWGRT